MAMDNREQRASWLRVFGASVVVAVTMAMPFHAWAVGSTPVTVVNATDLAKATGVQRPFQKSLNCLGPAANCSASFVVPANQRLVIEYVSARCVLDTGTKLWDLTIETNADGTGPVSHRLTFGDPSAIGVSVGQPVRLYAAPGSTVQAVGIEWVMEGPTPKFSCQFSLSGQAIDVP